jgi:uncharacterized PurR-regulated membrane protein YhhQ (DUF165 family)
MRGISKVRWCGLGCLAGFIGTVFGANWALTEWGVVNVGLGLEAPAAVYFVGLAFGFRDGVHTWLGRFWVLPAIIAGAALSYWLSSGTIPGGVVSIALASGIAFAVSELADWTVFEPMRKRGWIRAVAVSNLIGLVVDSLLFLWLAFGNLDFLWGQILGKAWMTALAVVVLYEARKMKTRRQARLA